MNERCLLVVSGPSGTGKDTVVNALRQAHPEIAISISATTRPMRTGEAEGVNYYYMTRESFEQKLQAGEILEHTEYCGNYYGTPRAEVDARITNGQAVVLVIEVEGAANVKRLYPGCTTVFIEPPGMDALEQRLRGRGTETEECIQKRLTQAQREWALADTYDYRVVNDQIEACAQRIYEILQQRMA